MKRLNIIIVVLLLAATVKASPVSRSEASALAASFLNQRSVTEVQTPFEHMYVFNGTNGFVILSSNDCVLPVLGYSLEQPFEMDMADATREWLQAYDEEIQANIASGVAASDEVRTAWTSTVVFPCITVVR